MLTIDQSQNGATVTVQSGDSFRVQLSENPTTGYRWSLTPPDDAAVRVTEDSFETSQGGLGVGGVRHWTFAADRPAAVTLQFARKRSWEKQAAENFTVTIEVNAR